MKTLLIFLALLPISGFSQKNKETTYTSAQSKSYVNTIESLTMEAAFALTKIAFQSASESNKAISLAVLDAKGLVLILVRGDQVGPHNTEASRKKAYTALSTKTASLTLMLKTSTDSTAANLRTLPELLLLGGGIPIWKGENLIGSLGVSGAGGSVPDHLLAKQAVEKLGFSTLKQ